MSPFQIRNRWVTPIASRTPSLRTIERKAAVIFGEALELDGEADPEEK